jgi:hypothetical protein
MYKFLIIAITLMACHSTYAQDAIVRKNNEIIKCEITDVDSAYVFFNATIHNKKTKTKIRLSDIIMYNWQGIEINLEELVNSVNNVNSDNLNIYDDPLKGYSGNYLYFSSSNIIKGKNIELKHPFLGYAYFLVDDVKYDAENVKFYQSEMGFFSNLRDVKASSSTIFSERERKGKINLYSSTTQSTSYSHGFHGGYGGGFGGGMYMGTTMPYTKYYYNKGFDKLKKVNYDNLKVDFQITHRV